MDIEVRERMATGGKESQPSGPKRDNSNIVKVAVVVVALLVAASLFAWNFGLFDALKGNPYEEVNPSGLTPEEEEQLMEDSKREGDYAVPPAVRSRPPSGS